MRSIAENIHLSAAKQPTQKLFWPWFLPILTGNSYTKPSEIVGNVERERERIQFEQECGVWKIQGKPRCIQCFYTIWIFWLGKNDFEIMAIA